MYKLITDKEARLALAQGNGVEYFNTKEPFDRLGWCDAKDLDDWSWSFSKPHYRFRFKQKTITINAVEVPAPFKPNQGDLFWYISSSEECGYDYRKYDSNYPSYDFIKILFGAWKTEEEIKQVVEAMRKPFKEIKT